MRQLKNNIITNDRNTSSDQVLEGELPANLLSHSTDEKRFRKLLSNTDVTETDNKSDYRIFTV